MRSEHPSWQDVLDSTESAGRDESFSRHIHRHIQRCRRCAEMADEARRLLEGLEAAAVRGPSDGLMDQTLEGLRRELRTRGGTAPSPSGALRSAGARLREVWATLVADSLRPTHAVRGATHASPRALVYETDDYAISLSLSSQAAAETLHIMGQLIPKKADSLPEGGHVELKAGEFFHKTRLTEFGEFRFRDIPKAELEIGVCLGDRRIQLAPPA